MNNVGKWNCVSPNHTRRYGSDTTYKVIAGWIRDFQFRKVEDWDCGPRYLRKLLPDDGSVIYYGVDGSIGYADFVEDIATRKTLNVDCIVLRQVLEHNDNWQEILTNALNQAGHVIVVLFTRLVPGESAIPDPNRTHRVPTLRLPFRSFSRLIGNQFHYWRFGREDCFLIESPRTLTS